MPSVPAQQALIDRLRSGNMPVSEVIGLLRDPAAVIRVNAVEALVVRARHDQKLLKELVAAASEPANGVRLMGTISVAHVAVGCLLRVGTDAANEAANNLLNAWPEPDRADLMWYLKSEGLDAVQKDEDEKPRQ
jgi:hypothetical protein